jgi:serine protease Do
MMATPRLLLFPILALTTVPATAQLDEPKDIRAAIAFAKKKVYPALVNIKVVSRRFSGGRTVRSVGSGSGTIINSQRHVLTNYHVARDAVRITCTMPSGEQIAADVVGHDAPTDVSVLKLRLGERAKDAKPLPYASLGDSDQVKVGDLVIAVGNPLSLSSSMTLGVVSNTRRVFLSQGGTDLQEFDFGGGDKTGLFTVWIQHDALILPGNSGGPLVSLKGEVIGVNTRTGSGYGFASPSNLVSYVVQQLLEHGEVRRGWLGASFQPVAKLSRKDGALTASVVPDSPAAAADLRPGDILVSLNGEPVVARFVEEIPLLYGRIAELRPASRVPIVFQRGGEKKQAEIEIAPMEAFIGREVEMRKLGVTVQDITWPMARARGYPDTRGALVTGIRAGEPFEEAKPKVRRGDLILKVAGRSIENIAAFEKAFASAKGTQIPVEYRRDHEFIVTVVEIEEEKPPQRGGELAKAWLGVRAQVLLPKVATAIGLEGRTGFRITEVYPTTKAAAAGLQVGDVLIAIDDEPLEASRPQDERDLRNRIENHSIGEEVEVTVIREGKKLTMDLELEESPASAQDAAKARSDHFELKVRELTRMDRIERHLPQDLRGVLVTEATAGGWAHIAGISAGQIILRIGGHAVGDPRLFERAVESIVADRPDVVLVFLRVGRRTTFRFIEPDWPEAKDEDTKAKAKNVNTKHNEAKPAAGQKPRKEKQ